MNNNHNYTTPKWCSLSTVTVCSVKRGWIKINYIRLMFSVPCFYCTENVPNRDLKTEVCTELGFLCTVTPLQNTLRINSELGLFPTQEKNRAYPPICTLALKIFSVYLRPWAATRTSKRAGDTGRHWEMSYWVCECVCVRACTLR